MDIYPFHAKKSDPNANVTGIYHIILVLRISLFKYSLYDLVNGLPEKPSYVFGNYIESFKKYLKFHELDFHLIKVIWTFWIIYHMYEYNQVILA